jgi:C4-dicarboxylate-specific signal transduction histidine kinase
MQALYRPFFADEARNSPSSMLAIRTLFRKVVQGVRLVDVNEIILETLQSLCGELKDHGIEARSELTPQLPLVVGNGSQLQVFNLINNAIEAMDTTIDRRRLLLVPTELRDRDEITILGTGNRSKAIRRMFGTFITTKSHGM